MLKAQVWANKTFAVGVQLHKQGLNAHFCVEGLEEYLLTNPLLPHQARTPAATITPLLQRSSEVVRSRRQDLEVLMILEWTITPLEGSSSGIGK